jgi:predicted phosphodiesterase
VLAVSGNHDLMALGELSDADLPPLQRRTIDWTRRAIDDVTREYLAGLPATRRTADGIVIAHGSLDSPRDYVRDCVAGVRQLGKLAEREPGARCLVLGHTHRPLACGGVSEQQDGRFELRADPWLVNPGAVGQSRERAAVARGAVIDLDLREVHLLAIEYDVREVRRQLRDAGLPGYAAHLAPGRAAKWRRRLGLY